MVKKDANEKCQYKIYHLCNVAEGVSKKPFQQEPVCASAFLYTCTQNPPSEEGRKESVRGRGVSCSEVEELFLSFIH